LPRQTNRVAERAILKALDQSGAVIHLREVSLRPGSHGQAFPFSVPAVQSLPALSFESPVTFLVGENGTGKSTVLEALAIATGLPAVASASLARDDTLAAQRDLAGAMRLAWIRRTHRGFFLRAEDFFGFTRELARSRDAFRRELAAIDEEYRDRSPLARNLARGPIAGSLGDMQQRYGEDLDANSHGQAFFRLFQSRFVPGGLYLLDEPEAPLSPQSQLGLIAMMKDMVGQEAQFIIATQSPILLAFPGEQIYTFDEPPVHTVAFDDLDHVRLTREFLQDPERFLRRL
jgi:predicted ATPase